MAIKPKKVKVEKKSTAVAKPVKVKSKSKVIAADDLPAKKKKKKSEVDVVSTGTSLYPMLGQDESLIRDENLADYTRRALFQYGSYVVEDSSRVVQPNFPVCTSRPDQWILVFVRGSHFDETTGLDLRNFKAHGLFLGWSL
jgi:hypothetical protein